MYYPPSKIQLPIFSCMFLYYSSNFRRTIWLELTLIPIRHNWFSHRACSEESCPKMSGGPKYEYLWQVCNYEGNL